MSRPKDTPQQWRARLEAKHPGLFRDVLVMRQVDARKKYGMSRAHISRVANRATAEATMDDKVEAHLRRMGAYSAEEVAETMGLHIEDARHALRSLKANGRVVTDGRLWTLTEWEADLADYPAADPKFEFEDSGMAVVAV